LVHELRRRRLLRRRVERYHAEEFGNEVHNELIARLIEPELDGAVLSMGGLWDQGATDARPYRVIPADLSREMLRA
jgi:hypothetical protein